MATIQLNEERRAEMLKEIQAFHREALDEDIGDLRARLFLDFLLKRVAPVIYNQALNDAAAFVSDKLVDLEGELFVEVER